MSHTAPTSTNGSFKKIFLLSISALGVVYGDIGTSPLYAISEIFFGHSGINHSAENILGGISLVVWALTLVICLKYVLMVLRADNDGEGGVFALSGLIAQIKHRGSGFIWLVSSLLIFAAGLLFGDGIITPAISVISAIEGLGVAAPSLSGFVVPLTILVLTGLFSVQKYGTAKVGGVFGPVIICWFLAIGLFGLKEIIAHPMILQAFNPWYAIRFLVGNEFNQILLVLGSVMLVITGGEAMYADMGHFGMKPIRMSWFALVYPMLLLSYLGQGAFLLSGEVIKNSNVFYSLIPEWALIPMVILATCATVIASQALISGAFSLTTQAIALGYFPRLKVLNTHHEHEGQRYVPLINWGLYAGSVALVLLFQSSTRLASAYGLAVSGDMLVNTLGMFLIAYYYWRWNVFTIALLLGPFIFLDMSFLISNSLKFFEGGFIPVAVALVIMGVMRVWNWGKKRSERVIDNYPRIKVTDLVAIKKQAEEAFPRSIVVMSQHLVDSVDDSIPVVEQMLLDRYGLLAKHIIFLTVVQQRVPYMHKDRFEVTRFFEDRKKGSIVSVKMNFGFMEEPLVETYLESLAHRHLLNISEHHRDWLIHVIDDRVLPGSQLKGPKWWVVKLYQWMDRNSLVAIDYLGLGNRVRLSTEVLPVHIRK